MDEESLFEMSALRGPTTPFVRLSDAMVVKQKTLRETSFFR
jgi:hypothetical protein